MNAKKELLKIIDAIGKIVDDIRCIHIAKRTDYDEYTTVLKTNSALTDNDWRVLDFSYDDGYGGQELFGCVLFKDNSWLERAEYDGSEWWSYKQAPTVNKILNWDFSYDDKVPSYEDDELK